MNKSPLRRPGLLAALFTREERLALAFLIGVGFVGLGILAWQKGRPLAQVEAPRWEPVRINRAGLEELIALPGVGPKTAQRILEARQRHGRFLTLSDLKRVKGLGAKTRERLEGLIRFD